RTSTRATWPLTPAATMASRAGSTVTEAVRVAVTAPRVATYALTWRGRASCASAAGARRALARAARPRAAFRRRDGRRGSGPVPAGARPATLTAAPRPPRAPG